jgi:hypothetical protein
MQNETWKDDLFSTCLSMYNAFISMHETLADQGFLKMTGRDHQMSWVSYTPKLKEIQNTRK